MEGVIYRVSADVHCNDCRNARLTHTDLLAYHRCSAQFSIRCRRPRVRVLDFQGLVPHVLFINSVHLIPTTSPLHARLRIVVDSAGFAGLALGVLEFVGLILASRGLHPLQNLEHSIRVNFTEFTFP